MRRATHWSHNVGLSQATTRRLVFAGCVERRERLRERERNLFVIRYRGVFAADEPWLGAPWDESTAWLYVGGLHCVKHKLRANPYQSTLSQDCPRSEIVSIVLPAEGPASLVVRLTRPVWCVNRSKSLTEIGIGGTGVNPLPPIPIMDSRRNSKQNSIQAMGGWCSRTRAGPREGRSSS